MSIIQETLVGRRPRSAPAPPQESSDAKSAAVLAPKRATGGACARGDARSMAAHERLADLSMTLPSQQEAPAATESRRWARRGLLAATLLLVAGALRVVSHAQGGSRLSRPQPVETPVSMEGEPQP